MTFEMSMEECMEALAKRADVQPVVTSTGPLLNWRTLDSASVFFHWGRISIEHACVGPECSMEGAGEGEQGVLRPVQAVETGKRKR
jgi:hypothetical protein